MAVGCDVRDRGAGALCGESVGGEGDGLIANISFWSAQKRIGNVAYEDSKAATDKMASDMALELRPNGVAAVSLYPGLLRTEKVVEEAAWLDMSNSESPEFTGRAVEYGFADVDGRQPRALTLGEV